MIELTYRLTKGAVSENIAVRLSDVRRARGEESPAPWDIGVTILWGDNVAFNHPLSGVDPLHAVELAAQFASKYLAGRASDEGGVLDPPIPPP